jgi:hypothetical protein
MAESLLDGCRESILKIAATQSPDGERAISILAEMFQADSGESSPGSRRGAGREARQRSKARPTSRT